MKKKTGSNWKLGIFVIAGILLFIVTIYYVGKQKNLFGSTFHLKTQFKTVGGLKEGNNVRYSGINVGTVNTIKMVTDTMVIIDILIKSKYQEFIKTDAMTSIGSDGLMGDKVLMISAGNTGNYDDSRSVKNNDMLVSKEAIEMEDIMKSLKSSVDNAAIITAQLAEFSVKMNNGKGPLSKLIGDEDLSNSIKKTISNLQASSNEFVAFSSKMNNGKGPLSKLINDESLSNSIKSTVTNLQASSNELSVFTSNLNNGEFGRSLDSTMQNIKGATKGLDENMEALQHNFLLRGFFKKKEKAEAKKTADQKKLEDKIKKEDAKKTSDSIKVLKLLLPAKYTIDSLL
jgi:phospholipid/cholesterol/gamma-HCH transport system substrate-binding protein